MKRFISELLRRNVIRMAGLYLVGAWLLVQVASTLLPLFGAPRQVLTPTNHDGLRLPRRALGLFPSPR